MGEEPAFVRRTSDWNGPEPAFTCVTTGMISVLAVGSDFFPGPTGVTRLIDTGAVVIFSPTLFDTVTVPVVAPGGRPTGLAVTVSVVPLGGRVPEAGDTVRND